MPVIAKCAHCVLLCGHAGRAQAIQMPNAMMEAPYLARRKPKGGACGMANLALTKPVDQINTNTNGMARSQALLCSLFISPAL
jgi:hypothetical protein